MEPRIQYARTSDGVDIAFFTIGDGMPAIGVPPMPWTHLEAELADPDYRAWDERVAHGADGACGRHVPPLRRAPIFPRRLRAGPPARSSMAPPVDRRLTAEVREEAMWRWLFPEEYGYRWANLRVQQLRTHYLGTDRGSGLTPFVTIPTVG